GELLEFASRHLSLLVLSTCPVALDINIWIDGTIFGFYYGNEAFTMVLNTTDVEEAVDGIEQLVRSLDRSRPTVLSLWFPPGTSNLMSTLSDHLNVVELRVTYIDMVLVLAEVLSQAYSGTNNWLLPGMNQLVLSFKTPPGYTFDGLDAGGDAPSDTVVNALFKLAGADCLLLSGRIRKDSRRVDQGTY
ncbi:hypothetical protein FRB99_003453, partial [Tulasnella sp. 403]